MRAAIGILVLASAAAVHAADGMQMRVRMIEREEGARREVANTVIAGPLGTDFHVEYSAPRYRLNASFVTDLRTADVLSVVCKLTSRRDYGRSPRGLPLYEEDLQEKAFDLRFDESLVLLPFGKAAGGDSLEIVISAERAAAPAGGAPEIRVIQPAPNGVLNVTAAKVPHRFRLAAEMRGPGSVRTAMAECRLGSPCRVALGKAMLTLDAGNDAAVCGHVAFRFSLSDPASRGAGSVPSGGTAAYPMPDGSRLQLQLTAIP